MNNIMNLVAATVTIITLANITQQELPAISRTGIAPEDLANLVKGNFKGNTKGISEDQKFTIAGTDTTEAMIISYGEDVDALLTEIYHKNDAELIVNLLNAQSPEDFFNLIKNAKIDGAQEAEESIKGAYAQIVDALIKNQEAVVAAQVALSGSGNIETDPSKLKDSINIGVMTENAIKVALATQGLCNIINSGIHWCKRI